MRGTRRELAKTLMLEEREEKVVGLIGVRMVNELESLC